MAVFRKFVALSAVFVHTRKHLDIWSFAGIFAGDVWAIVHHDTPELGQDDVLTMESALTVCGRAPIPEDTMLVTGRVTA